MIGLSQFIIEILTLLLFFFVSLIKFHNLLWSAYAIVFIFIFETSAKYSNYSCSLSTL